MNRLNCWVLGSFPALRAAMMEVGLSILCEGKGENREICIIYMGLAGPTVAPMIFIMTRKSCRVTMRGTILVVYFGIS